MPLIELAGARSSAYYDPYDPVIDENPYPVWKRLRNEQPLYYNEKHDFYALSRFDDVERCLKDWRRYSSAKGTMLELVKAKMTVPPGSILFEDPPSHGVHRALLAKVFAPRRIAALEPKIRAHCASSLDALVGRASFDFIADLAAKVPAWSIGALLGIPEQLLNAPASFADYIAWRAEHPSDDAITELLQAELAGAQRVRRRLSPVEVVGYVNILIAAGSETTTRLIGWAGKVLAEHPVQRRALVEDPTLIAVAIEELLRFESPSAVHARYVTADVVHYGQIVAEGSVVLLLTASANRDERRFEDADRFDIHRKPAPHVAFGCGVHVCLGAALARLGARVALEEVLERFPEWEVDWDRAVQAHTSTARGWHALPVLIP